MRENRTHGSEGGDGESRFRPYRRSPFSCSVGELKIMNHFVVSFSLSLWCGGAALGLALPLDGGRSSSVG